MEKFDVKEMWEKVKNEERYCTELQSYNSGGGIILTEMPIEYDGMDCVMLLDDDDYLSIYLNRNESDCDPFYDDSAVIYFYENERIPSEFVSYAKQLMQCKREYIMNWYGYDLQKYLEEHYNGELSYYDMFDGFTPYADEKAKRLLKKFNEAFNKAQELRQKLMDYLEDEYNVDMYEDADLFEDSNEFCFGIKEEQVVEVVKNFEREI